MSDAIAWLRQQVAESTPEDRKAAYKMADMGTRTSMNPYAVRLEAAILQHIEDHRVIAKNADDLDDRAVANRCILASGRLWRALE